MGSKVVRMMLLCFAEAHLKDVLLLGRRFHFHKGKVLLVSVKSEGSMIEWRRKVVRMMLLCFAGAHLQDVLLLDHRFDWHKGQILLVSMKSEGSIIEWEAKWLE